MSADTTDVSPMSAAKQLLTRVDRRVRAALIAPLRSRSQPRADDTRRVEDFAAKLASLPTFDAVLVEFRAQIEAALLPDRVFIFLPERATGDYAAEGTDIRFSASSTLADRLLNGDPVIHLAPGERWSPDLVVERPRLMILKAQVVIGLRGAKRLAGFVVITPPQSNETDYTAEDLRFLHKLTAQMSVAVERAQVVASLEQRVRELDVLSQVSQAVNFTIDFDDLLELISAQAGKLVQSSHFYITLHDASTNELYHAFFLEDGERYRDKEGLRWRQGSDPFSEVMRGGQPVRTANYGKLLEERGGAVIYEDPTLRAWMGVPLSAGGNTFGVMSVGAADADTVFSAEQQKIFMDIGSLAATSLDKARLFAETQMRARQLAALNDISRRLVASEANLEALLKLITASATDILNVEAGSLLLTADDGSGDLEFRVVVGGAEQDVIGSRIPAQRGLVGEVAATGQSVIVNDVASDRRWHGELSGSDFKTTNVLAVPLITQDRVIGVLEVMNKRSGGIFSRDDAELLNAFAGQAAVAIENARLFQLTDFQLSERVSELEALERIDVALNRSLDLAKVAELTIHWAVANTGATAGLLGVVLPDPPRLHVVYKSGYGDDDVPEGAQDDIYPLDRGIVSRTMRTRQPELVPDVSIDPHYVPSLRGAISQITLPMLSGGSVSAIMVLETNREPRLRLADMPFLQRLAEHASIAIANAQLYAELMRANESKSEFVSFVAHELKNPLTSIKGYADVLLSGAVGQVSDMQRNFLTTIRSNADRMNTLISDLNDVTKLQTNNLRMTFEAVDFNTVLIETLRPLQKQIDDKGQRLALDVAADLPRIHADENPMIQVMTNLISNAHKYTPEGGSIVVAAHVETEQSPNVLHVAVEDSGIGMSGDDLARLFTPYFRSDNPAAREQPGTGLGLAITRALVERHGGDIWVESEIGSGTTFHLTVPLHEE